MPNLKIIQRIMEVGLVPVVRASSTDEAGAIVEAIKTGGVSVLEITMTVPGAIELIEKIAERYGNDVLLGAGTVLDAETARVGLLAGAAFVVAPSPKTPNLETCQRYSKEGDARAP